jgi:hypothetical protein
VGCPRKKSGKSQRFSVRFSPLEGLLVYRGKFTLISPAGQVKPFLMLIRGAFGSAEDSRSGPQRRIKNDGTRARLRCRSRFVFYIFVSEASVVIEGRRSE